MADLHFVGGEKGGVGKSLVARTLSQYLLDNNLSCILFEADRSNPDLARIYGKTLPCQFAVFSEGERYEDTANKVFEAAITSRVLVNLPAQVFPAMKKWYADNELFEVAAEEDVSITIWFVADGGYDSLTLLAKSLEFYGAEVKHIIVRNCGRGDFDDWDAVLAQAENARLKTLIAEQAPVIIDFPKFIGTAERNTIDAESLTFASAREDSKRFSAISRQRVKKFLRTAYAEFNKAGAF
ncbi:MAG: hypothetical protein SWY16_04595 [Cyanobacteriota bacterium]|nr:hypothetical protein [Cyanobacteriota bacterium]